MLLLCDGWERILCFDLAWALLCFDLAWAAPLLIPLLIPLLRGGTEAGDGGLGGTEAGDGGLDDDAPPPPDPLETEGLETEEADTSDTEASESQTDTALGAAAPGFWEFCHSWIIWWGV